MEGPGGCISLAEVFIQAFSFSTKRKVLPVAIETIWRILGFKNSFDKVIKFYLKFFFMDAR